MQIERFFFLIDLLCRLASLIKEKDVEEVEPEQCRPEIVMHLENMEDVDEGKSAKFMVKIQGYPKPRVNWFLNKNQCINVMSLNTL